jgi:hypothetical protein
MGCALEEGMGGVVGAEVRGFSDDTEVAKKEACVLRAVSLKRECSQLSVSI